MVSILFVLCKNSQNWSSAITLLNNFSDGHLKLDFETQLCIKLNIIYSRLKLKDISDIKYLLDEMKDSIKQVSNPESLVYSKYFQALYEFYRVCCHFHYKYTL